MLQKTLWLQLVHAATSFVLQCLPGGHYLADADLTTFIHLCYPYSNYSSGLDST